MISQATPFSKLSLFRSTCAAIVSQSPATMPSLGMKEERDGSKCKPPTFRTGPLVTLAFGALTLCFALSAAAQPPWGSGGTVTSPFKDAEAPPTNLVCNLSDPRSNVEITTQPSAEIPFSEFTQASLDISGLLVCSEIDRVSKARVKGPGLFELVQTSPLVVSRGPLFAGWRVATLADMLDLGDSAGIMHTSTDVNQIAVAEQLRDWFCPPDHPNGDCANFTGTHDAARGLIADQTRNPPDNQDAFSVGRRFNADPNEVDFRVSGFSTGGGNFKSEQTYLVRDLEECEQSDLVALVGDATFGLNSVIRIRIVDSARCRDYLRLSETIPFSYNEVISAMVTTVSSEKSTPGFAFKEICKNFDPTGQVCIDLTRTWTVTALYGGGEFPPEFPPLLTDISYELRAADAQTATDFCGLSEGQDCRVFYGLEDPRFSIHAPVDGEPVIEVVTTTIIASPAVETPLPAVLWKLCHNQAFVTVGEFQINCTAPNGESAVTESENFVAEHQIQIEVVPTLNLNSGSSSAVLPVVVLGCNVEPDAIEFAPDGGPVFPQYAFVNGLMELPILVERFSVGDTRSSPSCDSGVALDDLNLKLNRLDFINAVKVAVPSCENRKASVPLSISVGNAMQGFLAGTTVVELNHCEVVE